MNICVFGCGAIGGHLATRLAATGRDPVSIVARGATLDAIRARGLTLISNGETIRSMPAIATDDPATLARQDLVLVALKAPTISAAAPAIARLLAPGAAAVFVGNGIPWWWTHGASSAPGPLPRVDADGATWRAVGPERALGAVIYAPSDVVEPGTIRHTGPAWIALGEPDGSASARLESARDALVRSGLDARLSPDLRGEVLRKLVYSVSGVVCALARLDLGAVAADEGLRALSRAAMHEVVETAAALGYDFRGELDLEAIAARGRPGVRPSMLQDALAGRALEVEAIVGQVHAFARERGVPVPTLDALLPLLRGVDASIRAAARACD
jgi:2-dehydropantoate 2-reductase